MSMWGAELVVDGVTMLPLVGGDPFTVSGASGRLMVPPRSAPIVTVVLLNLGMGCTPDQAAPVLKDHTDRFVGRPYSEWLDLTRGLWIGNAQPLEVSTAEPLN